MMEANLERIAAGDRAAVAKAREMLEADLERSKVVGAPTFSHEDMVEAARAFLAIHHPDGQLRPAHEVRVALERMFSRAIENAKDNAQVLANIYERCVAAALFGGKKR